MRNIVSLATIFAALAVQTGYLADAQTAASVLPPPPRNLKLQPSSGSPLRDIERDIVQQINQYRAERNLPALRWEAAIAQLAREHSQGMATKRIPFGHTGFSNRIEELRIPYRSAAENVAFNSGYTNPAAQAVDGWLKSPKHRKNIEGNFNLTGIGVSRGEKGEYYLTQVFILQ